MKVTDDLIFTNVYKEKVVKILPKPVRTSDDMNFIKYALAFLISDMIILVYAVNKRKNIINILR